MSCRLLSRVVNESKSSILTCSRPFCQSVRPGLFAQEFRHSARPQPLPTAICLRNSRFFSVTSYSQYPRYHKGRTKQKERDTTRRGKDALTQAQEDLENAALVVTKKDAQIVKELGHDTSFETYVKLVLSRLRPFLVYFAHHGPQQFLLSHVPPMSPMARARIATLYLFISSHAWFSRAMVARSSGSSEIPPELVNVAEQFTKTGNAVEAYAEDKLPEGMTWADVGGAIVDSSSEAWFVLRKAIGLEDGAVASSAPSAPSAFNTHNPPKESQSSSNGRT